MHSNGKRDYDPRLGRYVESDPIGLDGGINTYAYAGNDPVNAIDPLGLYQRSQESDPDALPEIDIEAQQSAEELRLAPAELPPIDIAGQQRVVVAQAGLVGQFVVNAVRGAAAALGRGAAKTTEIVAQNGTKVTGFTKHGINRVVGDGAKRAGVKPEALLDALKNPKKITSGVDSQGRPYQIFTGQDARVVVNPQTGQVVSTNPLSGAGAH